jgi:hypothetical protein
MRKAIAPATTTDASVPTRKYSPKSCSSIFLNRAIAFAATTRLYSFRCAGNLKAGPTKPDNTQTGLVEIREVAIVFLPHPRLAKGRFN